MQIIMNKCKNKCKTVPAVEQTRDLPGMAIPGGGSEAGVGWAAGATGSTLLPFRLLRAFFLAWISLRALDIMALI